ncbi:hypothetical protein F5ESL0263_01550 [Lactobacillus sp. ESL0263]|nr:hypothetical protein F5ESL0263_01550 [Lactobacillus sp. ESL0263]
MNSSYNLLAYIVIVIYTFSIAPFKQVLLLAYRCRNFFLSISEMLDSDLAEDMVNKTKINKKESIKMVLKLTLTALKNKCSF